jgi:hypothetical protein
VFPPLLLGLDPVRLHNVRVSLGFFFIAIGFVYTWLSFGFGLLYFTLL